MSNITWIGNWNVLQDVIHTKVWYFYKVHTISNDCVIMYQGLYSSFLHCIMLLSFQAAYLIAKPATLCQQLAQQEMDQDKVGIVRFISTVSVTPLI